MLGFLVISLTACGSTEEVPEAPETSEVNTETESTSETVVTKDIVESEDIMDLGLDNALLELDLVE